jgi:hypothetical protein
MIVNRTRNLSLPAALVGGATLAADTRPRIQMRAGIIIGTRTAGRTVQLWRRVNQASACAQANTPLLPVWLDRVRAGDPVEVNLPLPANPGVIPCFANNPRETIT